jgi:hypothetical protein
MMKKNLFNGLVSTGRKLTQFGCIAVNLPTSKRQAAAFIFINGADAGRMGFK